MTTVKSESTARPPEWDKDTSPDIVYHNYNIAEVPQREATDPIRYTYDQDQYTAAEYVEYLNDQRLAEIESNQDAILLALADLNERGVSE